jgi:hypothetical protein
MRQLDLFGGSASRAPERPRASPEPRPAGTNPAPTSGLSAGRTGAAPAHSTHRARRRVRGSKTGPAENTPPRRESATERPARPEGGPQPTARPYPLTAREAGRDTLVAPLLYVGIVTSRERVVCAQCLTRDGAQRSLAGEKFARYLWRPGTGFVEACTLSACDVCGFEVHHEAVAVPLTASEVSA